MKATLDNPCEPHWIAIISSLSIPLIASIGLFIAYRQWVTSREKLKLDLFDRRYRVYDSVKTFIYRKHGPVKGEEIDSLRINIAEARWLYSKEFEDYLHENVLKRATRLKANQRMANDELILRLITELYDLLSNELNDKFYAYLHIQHDCKLSSTIKRLFCKLSSTIKRLFAT